MRKVKIRTSAILITHKGENGLEVIKIFGQLYTYFIVQVPESCLLNNYMIKTIIDSEIVKKYSRQYKNIVNIFYEKFNIEYNGNEE